MFGSLMSPVVQGDLMVIVMMGVTAESYPLPDSWRVDVCIAEKKVVSVCQGTYFDKTAKARAAFQRLSSGQAEFRFEGRTQVSKATGLTTSNYTFNFGGVKRFTI